ncbi:hypothetical protein GCM10007094_37470 [Pseudovibrio japonicus]|uniref:Outer membrane protein beta-barrel domain-containing protein n=1 Tax=Pseudovibrio japonicus TaxID=366534 RepID=A0ABQ3ETP5_9HYPH|nr:outer membrane beta-barrel protein [Pseudovibrio japonicus]GHB44639.1 hypothetical protein GCM10007094_37470 [Pseudovibrio japonicus]
MTKFGKLLCATALVSAVAFPAQADELLSNVYLGLSGGVSIAPDADLSILGVTFKDTIEFDTGYGFSANAGYRLNEFLRVQADLGYLENDVDSFDGIDISDGSLSGAYGVLSVYGDYHINQEISVFAGIGGGFFAPHIGALEDTVGVAVKFESKQDAVALLKVGTGVSYSLNENLDLIASYDYLRSADFDVREKGATLTGDMHLSTHLAQVGLRYNF